jgi:hypothetical protein
MDGMSESPSLRPRVACAVHLSLSLSLSLIHHRTYVTPFFVFLVCFAAASIAAAYCLNVRPGDKVLDMCAAPGGKSLIVAEALGPNGSLVSNDISRVRCAHLSRVLEEYIQVLFPPSLPT